MYKEQIIQYFTEHKNEMIESIFRLVRIPSVRGEATPTAPYGEQALRALQEALVMADEFGFATTNYDNYVMAADFNNKEKGLDILAHLDVVAAPPEDWTITQPFVPVEQNGKIYGRGTADDKGPAVAALYAMKAVKDMGFDLSKNVRLILGTDEELGSSDLDHYYSIEKEAPMSFTPDADFPVINVEKGRLSTDINAEFASSDALPRIISINAGHTANVVPDKGTIVLEGFTIEEVTAYATAMAQKIKVDFTVTTIDNKITVQVHGVGGHAAHPEVSKNAVTAALSLVRSMPFAESEGFIKISALADIFPYGDWLGENAGIKMADPISGDLTISLNILTMDDTTIHSRFDSRCSLNATEENVNQVLAKNAMDKGLIFVEQPLSAPHHVSEDSDFVKTLLKCYEQYSGKKGECLAIGGGTYVHNLKNGVAFGSSMPGTENNMHGADEFAVIDELILSAQIYAQAIIDLCL